MGGKVYALAEFIGDMRRIVAAGRDENEVITGMRPLVQRFAQSSAWRRPEHDKVDPEQGFGVYPLHEEPDHSLAVFAVSWSPGRGTPPHDHGVWAVVVGVDGPEANLFWERVDDGSRPGHAELRQIGRKVFGPGEVLAMPKGTIHSVVNESGQVTMSLHVYGKHINHTTRSQFDPAQRTERPFIVKLD